MKQNNENIKEKQDLINKIREADEKKKRRKKFINRFLTLLIAVMIIGVVGYFTNEHQEYKQTTEYKNPLNLSQSEISCLALNYKFYGTLTCPHCNNQKEYLGKDIVDVTYVGCDENPELCQKMGIEGVPYHYIINSETGNYTILMGEQTIDDIFNASQCEDKVATIDMTN